MNPWVGIILQYGMEFAIELAKILENTGNPTAQDFTDLKAKYGAKTADSYLKEAQASVSNQATFSPILGDVVQTSGVAGIPTTVLPPTNA